MKHLSQNLRSGKLSIDDVPEPELLSGQLIVETRYSLISAGTERTKIETGKKSLLGKALSRPDQVRQVIQSFKSAGFQATYQKVITKLDSRSPIGYSASGVVLYAGDGVGNIQVGDLVACGGATAAHAEVISVPANLCVKVPSGVNADEAAFTTVGAIALQGIRQADVRLGENVVVIGLGLVGALTVQMLRAAGCYVLGYDTNEEKCRMALELGAQVAVNNEGVLRNHIDLLSNKKGCDAVIITAGTTSNRPVEFAGEICREKGKVVVVGAVGLTLPRAPYYDKEIDFKISRSYGPGRYDVGYEEKGQDYPYGYVRWTENRNMQAFLDLVADGKINIQKLITHRFPIDKAEEAYDLISGKVSGNPIGVLFEYAGQVEPSKVILNKKILSTTSLNGKVGVGVIGAGNFAQSMLLPHLSKNPDVSLVSSFTINPLQTMDVMERFGFEKSVSSQSEILDDPKVKAVVIASRHDSHAGYIVEALKNGKAVHVEKPLAMNEAELNEITQGYQTATNPFVLVGFNRRFSPLVEEMVKFFHQSIEPFTMTYRINAGYIPLDHWTQDAEQGGGRIIGEVCHFLDLLQFISRSKIQSVYAASAPNLGKYNNDNISVTLKMANGSVGNILYTANGNRNLPKEYIEVFSGGKAAVLNDFHTLDLITDGKSQKSNVAGQDKGHKKEMSEWVNAIKLGKSEPIPFEESVIATRASFAVIESINSGEAMAVG